MLEALDTIKTTALSELKKTSDKETLRLWYSTHLSKNSPLIESLRNLSNVAPKDRPAIGKHANQIRNILEEAYKEQTHYLHKSTASTRQKHTDLDITLPGRSVNRGRLHIATQTLRRIYTIWADMGFQIYRSREIETDELNFELLNIPLHHPARDMWDTFHTNTPGVILRTHTSPGQIHAMRANAPDSIRVILPGMCYRYEQITARSEIQFNQVEGLAIGTNIRFTDLKGTLTDFARRMFGNSTRTRFRASHFPFTEPSAEMDVECFLCSGEGCRVCKKTGWLEILGCGMVHPAVLTNGGYEPNKYTGFAFGMGPERIAMLKYGIDDIRHFWGNDLRFLEQF